MSPVGLLLSLLVISAPGWAVAPAIDSISGASGSDLTGTVTIYGSVNGKGEQACSGNGISTCSNCTEASFNASTTCLAANRPLCVCGTQMVYDGLSLQINLKNVAANSPNVYLAYRTGGSSGTYLLIERVGIASPSSVVVDWREICRAVASVDCSALSSTNPQVAGTLSLTDVVIFADKNANKAFDSGEESTPIKIDFLFPDSENHRIASATGGGIYSFVPFPGDEKAYVTEAQSNNAFPTLYGGAKAVSTRVFLSTTAMDDANILTANLTRDLTISSGADGADFNSNIVDGLANGTTYFVRLAQVDQGGNILYYFPDKLTATTCATAATCPYIVTPDQVLGLLSKDVNCFVATAAYGTSLGPKLDLFRRFRNQVLLRRSWGVNLVKAYYHYGPFAARYIADKPALRAITRLALWPAYAFSYLALRFGLASALGVLTLLLSALLALPWFGVRRYRSRG